MPYIAACRVESSDPGPPLLSTVLHTDLTKGTTVGEPTGMCRNPVGVEHSHLTKFI
jgi:hypothetical protein